MPVYGCYFVNLGERKSQEYIKIGVYDIVCRGTY